MFTSASLAFNNKSSSFTHLQEPSPEYRAEAQGKENMKVNITEWNTVAIWRWDLPEDDVCGICQVHFDGTCPTCKYPGDDCQLCEYCHQPSKLLAGLSLLHRSNTIFLVSGKCGHNFHMHCIMEWIKQEASRGQCPMCRQRKLLEPPPLTKTVQLMILCSF